MVPPVPPVPDAINLHKVYCVQIQFGSQLLPVVSMVSLTLSGQLRLTTLEWRISSYPCMNRG
jgi:hypothetical protein